MILNLCDLPEALSVMRIVNIVIKIIKIVVPILLIVSAMIDLVKAVMDAELNKISKPMVNKVIAAVLIFLIPTLVSVIAEAVGNDGEYKDCLGEITIETINQAYINREEELLSKAENTNNLNDYNDARNYLIHIKDEEKREEYNNRLNIIKEELENRKEKNDTNDTFTSGTGINDYEYYRQKAIQLLHSDVEVTQSQIDAAAERVGMTTQEFNDAVEWAACENGHLMNPYLYCNGDMDLAASITYLNISASINLLNLDSGCNHSWSKHMSKHEGMTVEQYKQFFSEARKIYYDKYYNTYMKFAVAIANDLAPVYMWPPHADRVIGVGYINGKMYYTHKYYIPPFDPFGTNDGFVTLRASTDSSTPLLNPYDVVEWRKKGISMLNY